MDAKSLEIKILENEIAILKIILKMKMELINKQLLNYLEVINGV